MSFSLVVSLGSPSTGIGRILTFVYGHIPAHPITHRSLCDVVPSCMRTMQLILINTFLPRLGPGSAKICCFWPKPEKTHLCKIRDPCVIILIRMKTSAAGTCLVLFEVLGLQSQE